ncbi:Cytochrome c oxidase, subunit VIb [Cinara cedri]|uniref:Cytochrome c oxidase, subunit VIb n=1 Tax=Cinara cedri TaxID=506608 RepID=A0A5E4MU52_9HEMI|nr:Cytochrome c oxidase, subunit VIb [Cinara cedri]
MSGKEEFLSKSERTTCWSSRDYYWECLRSNNEEAAKCTDLRKIYESSCPAQWVKHFDRKFNYLKFKEKMETEGYEPLNNI